MADGLCTGDTVSNAIEKTLVKDYDNVIECITSERVNDVSCENVKSFLVSSDSDQLFVDKLCGVKGSEVEERQQHGKHEEFLDMEMPCSPAEEDCRKKRCADRYDSSESSDSGVAVLSCTDCSGSSTASSDITDPGSPFSTASSHSEDSASQPAKMPPTQSAHHPPWPWATGDSSPMKRHTTDKTAFPKRLKTSSDEEENAGKHDKEKRINVVLVQNDEEGDKKKTKPPICLSSATLNHLSTSQIIGNHQSNIIINNNNNNLSKSVVSAEIFSISNESTNSNNKAPSSNLLQTDKLVKCNSGNSNKKMVKKPQDHLIGPKIQGQGKITEYFKSQMKANGIKKELSSGVSAMKSQTNLNKYFSLVGGLKQNSNNNNKTQTQNNVQQRKTELRTPPSNPALRKVTAASDNTRNRKLSPVTVPRKILPAPSKVCDKVTVNNINNVSSVNSFAPPTVTLTTLAIPPNLTYLHTKTPKPPDNFIVQQFTTATLGSDKINAIPIVSTPCINTTVLHPLQKITTINNFNCIKLNATVVPIVKLNTLPSKINGSNFSSVALNVEAGVPTVLPVKAKVCDSRLRTPPVVNNNVANITTQKQQSSSLSSASSSSISSSSISSSSSSSSITTETATSVHHQQTKRRIEEESPASSDSGISSSSSVSSLSSLSNKSQLEVSVNQVPNVEPQKSPILSQPKTIRFPAKQNDNNTECNKETRSTHSSDSTSCRWAECHAQFDTSGALLEHLQIKHVISQATQEQYVCLWLGCKVHGRTSCSRTWLERHVLAHAGTKPFRCIVEGCGMRFNSQLSLERHVNGHFNSDGSQNGTTKKSVENGSVKLYKRNGKRIRFRRQPWSARLFDFFDNGIMEGLQHRLLTMTEAQTRGQREAVPGLVPGDTVLLHSQMLARRVEPDGKTKMLLRWHPADVIPDEWVEESEYSSTKTVSIRTLQPTAVNALKPILFPSNSNSQLVRQKQRRKPFKCT